MIHDELPEKTKAKAEDVLSKIMVEMDELWIIMNSVDCDMMTITGGGGAYEVRIRPSGKNTPLRKRIPIRFEGRGKREGWKFLLCSNEGESRSADSWENKEVGEDKGFIGGFPAEHGTRRRVPDEKQKR